MNKKISSMGTMKVILYIVVLVILCILALMYFPFDFSTVLTQSKTAKYELVADQLHSEYKNNKDAADSKYKGQIVIVYGLIKKIDRDEMGNSYIIIAGEDLSPGVKCVFSSSELRKSLNTHKLSLERPVHVKGKVKGMLKENVVLIRCRIQ